MVGQQDFTAQIMQTLAHTLPQVRMLGVWLFGSHARGEATTRSDLDLAVLAERRIDPLALGAAAFPAVGAWLSAWAVALSPHATLLAAAQAGEAGTAAAAAIEIWWAMAYAAPYAVCQSWRCRGAAVVLRVSTHCVQCRTARE
jgi:hypothetical protein